MLQSVGTNLFMCNPRWTNYQTIDQQYNFKFAFEVTEYNFAEIETV